MGLLEIIKGEEPNIFKQIVFLLQNKFDKGKFGEYLIEYSVGNICKSIYGCTMRNLYIPYKGKTSEIDVLLITSKGIVVIESKNYSGWIFGSEEQYQWTQCLQNRQKNRFYNPIKQNITHMNALQHYLNINKDSIKSYIVFSERCTLKKVPQNTKDYTITKRNKLLKSIKTDLENQHIIFSNEAVDNMIKMLTPLTNVSDEEKMKHIQEIQYSKKKQNYSNDEIIMGMLTNMHKK